MNPDEMSFIICAVIESLIRKIDGCANDPDISSKAKNRWGYFWWIFDVNNLRIWSHRKQTCFISWKRLHEKVFYFCKRTSKKIVDFEKRKIWPLPKEELKSHQDANVFYICGKRILKKLSKSINYQKLQIIAIIQVSIEVQIIFAI